MRSLALAALLFATTSFARDWWADHLVQALEEPNGKRVVFELPATVAAELLKRGGPGGAWCKLRFGLKEGWVPCAEADRATAQLEKTPRLEGEPPCATACTSAPLFPSTGAALTESAKEVLRACPSDPSATVSGADVRRFFAAHYEDGRIQRALSAAGRAGRKEDNLDWLTSLWTGTGPKNAFTHVFCGDAWDKAEIGGLHWLPRYRQLEGEGKLCFDGPVKKGGAKQAQAYLLRFHATYPWSCGRKPVGGFSHDEDPVTLAAAATRAFVRCCTRAGRHAPEGGVFGAPDLGKTTWQIHCGRRDGTYGIDTFHPSEKKATCGE